MAKRLLVESRPLETRVALVEDGKLTEISIERDGGDGITGNIYLGRVENILPGMQAAFVNIGMEKNAFLFAGDFQMDKTDFGSDESAIHAHFEKISIQKMLKVGQEILVQIIKLPGGNKGPRISSHITLPGRLSVLLPTVAYTGISRRIEEGAERERLREIAGRLRPEGMGVIVRTAAEGASEEELSADIAFLRRQWDALAQRGAHAKAPRLVYQDHDLVFRAIRDLFTGDIEQMAFEDEDAFARGREAVRLLAPEMENRVILEGGDIPLFVKYGVQTQLERALNRRVWLKSGGYLVFDQTEALTVIDVNTGKFVGKSSLSDTVFKINLEAAGEIARQLRLRDIGGIIIVDFIDMDKAEQKEQLLSLLKQELKRDRTRTNVIGLTGLGLVEMTRKKRREPLVTRLKAVCPLCAGEGNVPSLESTAIDAFSALQKRFREQPGTALLVRACGDACAAMAQLRPNLAGRAFCVEDARMHGAEFSVLPVLEHELPQGSRRISGGDNE